MDQVGKMAMFQAVISMEYEQPRTVPPLRWLLGNQLGRKMEIEISGSHVAATVADGAGKKQFTVQKQIVNNF